MSNTKVKEKQASLIAKANKLFRKKQFNEALDFYQLALNLQPELHKIIIPNLEMTRAKIKKSGEDVIQSVRLVKPEAMDGYTFKLIEESGLFDAAWYLTKYSSKDKININPLEHYIAVGFKKGFNPSSEFDTEYYIDNNPDLLSSDIHPFVHFVAQGIKEGRRALPPLRSNLNANYSVATPQYIPRLPTNDLEFRKVVRAIAFYLPQFHPIDENDKWWGKGFTEWTNVKPAQPKFVGHYQPHIPDDYLGYYNLLDEETQSKQVALAKQYGIEGFCFYIYWFAGHRLLEKPTDNYLGNTTLTLPFCVCWANENWSRRWDGLDQDILMAQHYSSEDDINFIINTARYLRDPRYIRINEKPLLLIYRPKLFPNIKATTERWRNWCRGNGIGEIFLAYPQSFESEDPAEYGFDAACEFPPNNSSPEDITNNIQSLVKDLEAKIYDWRSLVVRSENYEEKKYTLFRSIVPSWDNTARKGNKGSILHNSCPELFRQWAVSAFSHTVVCQPDPDKRIVFINAWNEWAEGAHLEPDKKYGYAWLQAVRDAHELTAIQSKIKVAIVIHAYYPEIFEEIIARMKSMNPLNVSLYVTASKDGAKKVEEILVKTSFKFIVKSVENRGRDVLPFLKLLPQVIEDGADLVLKLHTKKSLHRSDGERWRRELYDSLLSPSFINWTRLKYSLGENFGLSAPVSHVVPMSYFWGSNRENVERLCVEAGIQYGSPENSQFVAGTMFFATKELLIDLMKINILDSVFEDEDNQVDGTMAHAVERLFGHLSQIKNRTILKFGIKESEDYPYATSNKPNLNEVEK